MAPAPLLSVKNVVKSYPRPGGEAPTPVLRGVDLDVVAGEFVSLMGSSGSGKTTLLNLVGGLDTADTGSIEVEGTQLRDLGDKDRSTFRLRKIGFVFQFFNLLPNLTVAENISLPLLFLGHPEKEALAQARAIAVEVGLGDKLPRLVHQLSGGEMQRVGIARALVHRPRLLLADEPTGNLDSRTGETILQLLRATGLSHGVTIIMATHDQQAADASDRVIRMVDGQVVGDGAH